MGGAGNFNGKSPGNEVVGFHYGYITGGYLRPLFWSKQYTPPRGAFICSIGVYTNANATVILACVAGV